MTVPPVRLSSETEGGLVSPNGELQHFQGAASSTSSPINTVESFIRSKGVQRWSTTVSQTYPFHSLQVTQNIPLSTPLLPASFPALGDLHTHPHHPNYSTTSEEPISSSNCLFPSPLSYSSCSVPTTPRGGVAESFFPFPSPKKKSSPSALSSGLLPLFQQQQPQQLQNPPQSVDFHAMQEIQCCPISSVSIPSSASSGLCSSSLSGKSPENSLDCIEEQKQSYDDGGVDVIPAAVSSVSPPFSDEKRKGKSGTSSPFSSGTSCETSKNLQWLRKEEKSNCMYRDAQQQQQQQQSNQKQFPSCQSLPSLFVQQQQQHHQHWLTNTAAQQNPHQQNPHQQNPHQQNPHQQNPHQQNPHQQNPYQTQIQHQYHRSLVAQQQRRMKHHQQQYAMQLQCMHSSAKRHSALPMQIVRHRDFPSLLSKSKESFSSMSQQQHKMQQQQQQYPHFVPRKPHFINPYFVPVVQPSTLQVRSHPPPAPPPKFQTLIQHQNVPYVDHHRQFYRHPTPSSSCMLFANSGLITSLSSSPSHHVKRRIQITDGNEVSSSLPPPHLVSKKSSSSSFEAANTTSGGNTQNLKSNSNSAHRSRSSAYRTTSSSSNLVLDDGGSVKANRSSSNPASRNGSRRITVKGNSARRTKSQKSKREIPLDSSSPTTTSLRTMKSSMTSDPTITTNDQNNNSNEIGKGEKREEINERRKETVYRRTQDEDDDDETMRNSRKKEWTMAVQQKEENIDSNLGSSSSSGKEKKDEGVNGTIQATVKLYRTNSITGEVDVRSVPMISINEDPEIFVLPGFLSKEECDHICQICEMQTWERSRTSKGGQSYPQSTYTDLVSPIRTSSSVRITTAETPTIRAIEQRVAAVAKMSVDYVEPFVVVRYGVGEFFKEHHDDVEEGGETEFPYLGFRIKPERGTGIYWKNLDSSGKANQLMNHSGLPPLKGLKYIVNCFINKDPVSAIGPELVEDGEKKENEKEREQEVGNGEKRVETPLISLSLTPREGRVGSSLESFSSTRNGDDSSFVSHTYSQSSNVSSNVHPANLRSMEFPSSLSSISLSSTSSSSSASSSSSSSSVPPLSFSSSSAAPLFSNPSFIMLPGHNGSPQLLPLFSTSGGLEQQPGGGGGVGSMTSGKENESLPLMSSIINMMMGSMSKMMPPKTSTPTTTSTSTSTSTTAAEATMTTSSLVSTNSSSPSTSHCLTTPCVYSPLPHQHIQSRPYTVASLPSHSDSLRPKGLAVIQEECEYEVDARLSSCGSDEVSTSPPVLLCGRKEMSSTRVGGEGGKGRTTR